MEDKFPKYGYDIDAMKVMLDHHMEKSYEAYLEYLKTSPAEKE